MTAIEEKAEGVKTTQEDEAGYLVLSVKDIKYILNVAKDNSRRNYNRAVGKSCVVLRVKISPTSEHQIRSYNIEIE